MTDGNEPTPGDGEPRDDEPDDPGRDPVGLHPPRDLLDSVGGVTDEGGYTPGRPSAGERQAGQQPDQPPTGSGEGGP